MNSEGQGKAAAPPDDAGRHFCQLFEDMVQNEVCLLRRHALNRQDDFSCAGCKKDLIEQSRAGARFITMMRSKLRPDA